MTKPLKKHDFSLRLERHFTSEDVDALDLLHFEECETGADDSGAAFEKPHHWSDEAAAAFAAGAANRAVPAYTRSIEENTIPSWLWRRSGEDRLRSSENSVRQVFHRVAGAATYAGWQNGLFADENEARIFFDETIFMLAQRFIAFDPRDLANSGLDWAYGIESKPSEAAPRNRSAEEIRNAGIDALLAGDKTARQKWHKLLTGSAKSGHVEIAFSDIGADWNSGADGNSRRAALDLFAFRREDGAIHIERLIHAARLLTILLELMGPESGVITLHNLAPLLMSQALPYDSDAGRATAGALTALVTAEACATSAQLAALLGPSLEFAAQREGILRALRNHRRAAYGDRNDYEKISVLPAPLTVDPAADLALIAAARRRWDEALGLVQQYGLRATRYTDLAPSPELAFFSESLTEGVAPMPILATSTASGRSLHPAVAEALAKLGYTAAARATIGAHIIGAGSLTDAPGVNYAALRRRGFNDEALEKIEHYLPKANDIRLAFTIWNLGEPFTRGVLKIPNAKAEDARFDMLKHLGFSAADIDAANAHCYGTGSAAGAKGLKQEHVPVFAIAAAIAPLALIDMAAAVQSFISGDAGLQLALPADAAEAERLMLAAWRQGVKSVAVEFTAAQKASSPRPQASPRVPLPEYKAPMHSALAGRRAKASKRLVGLDRPSDKSSSRKRGHKDS
jgi:ribonucleotide reductase alpha subunit